MLKNYVKICIWSIGVFFSPLCNYAQFTTTDTLTSTQLVQLFVGSRITVSNITYKGFSTAIGSFSGPSNIGLSNGVLMTTGTVSEAIGPNNYSAAGIDNGYPGDADLTALSGHPTMNAAILEFDFIPSGDSMSFRYVFASEEYPEYVCCAVNDVFGFFISGVTTPFPKTNIAILPGGLPVSINTVNQGKSYLATAVCINPNSSCSFVDSACYINNGTGDPSDPLNGTTIQYDGFTTVMNASVIVKCEETYHIKIAISDATDGDWDSGVFLEKASFSSHFRKKNIQVPNVFTPNKDGKNDEFVISGTSECINEKVKLRIFNRWGGAVYESDDYQNNWTGNDLMDGVYFYVVSMGNGLEKSGYVTLISTL